MTHQPEQQPNASTRILEDRLARLYRLRREAEDPRWRRRVWSTLVTTVFQPLIHESDTVVDLGAGWCEFINAVRAKRKIAVDVNPEVQRWAHDAEVLIARATDLAAIPSGSVDVVFSSNLLEHLPGKDSVLRTLAESNRILRPGGLLITLMPNLRYLGPRYWDYFDHLTPLTHKSLAEAYELEGFEVVRLVPRFVPYALRDGMFPRSELLVRLYLRLPPLWWIFGRQMLAVGRKPPSRGSR